MKTTEEILFDFIRDMIYNPKKAAINLDNIDENYKNIAKALVFLKECIVEERELAENLAKGNLEISLPGSGNVIAFPLKALHSSLKHLVWQARQIEKGDLNQTLDFMGDFSEVFNKMRDELKTNRETLRVQAFRDPLTMLYNRRYVMEVLEKMIAEKRQFSLCFVDLDNLKYVNDVFGHLEGDKFIMGVADCLRNDFPEGIIGRIGGDEYMVLLPGISESEMEKRMGNLCEKLSSFGRRPDGRTRPPLSYGIVEVGKDNEFPTNQILAEADKRMYALKAEHKVIFNGN